MSDEEFKLSESIWQDILVDVGITEFEEIVPQVDFTNSVYEETIQENLDDTNSADKNDSEETLSADEGMLQENLDDTIFADEKIPQKDNEEAIGGDNRMLQEDLDENLSRYDGMFREDNRETIKGDEKIIQEDNDKSISTNVEMSEELEETISSNVEMSEDLDQIINSNVEMSESLDEAIRTNVEMSEGLDEVISSNVEMRGDPYEVISKHEETIAEGTVKTTIANEEMINENLNEIMTVSKYLIHEDVDKIPSTSKKVIHEHLTETISEKVISEETLEFISVREETIQEGTVEIITANDGTIEKHSDKTISAIESEPSVCLKEKKSIAEYEPVGERKYPSHIERNDFVRQLTNTVKVVRDEIRRRRPETEFPDEEFESPYDFFFSVMHWHTVRKYVRSQYQNFILLIEETSFGWSPGHDLFNKYKDLFTKTYKPEEYSEVGFLNFCAAIAYLGIHLKDEGIDLYAINKAESFIYYLLANVLKRGPLENSSW